jgi:hypothetical protein
MANEPDWMDDEWDGLCGICGGVGSEVYGGGCCECDPSVGLEYSPVRASFRITDGVVTEMGL